ncbi:BCOR [Branchiostoma lanceolatum]|uniref:BCOR protein n=1 Tax=Branchiostoma lanceolatum TaxID=7740 RepID=A0A8K0EBY2_BRALA|nr:BCOR [Branchiostoma lanceolatum]
MRVRIGSVACIVLLPDGSTPLHLACREGFHDVVDYLIVKGADINIRDSAGKTALQYQAQAANSTSASNGTLQASEEQPEEAADEVNQLTAKPASRCNGQDNIGNKRTAESATTSSLSQDIRPPLAASTPNLMKLHSLKQALSTTQGKRKREGKDQSFSGIKRIPGQNEYEMETHHKSMAKSEASQNDSMSDLTTPLQIRIPKPREAILQRHALPPELSPQGDSHLLQTCTGDDNGPLDLSLKRNSSAASHVQSAANSKTRNTLQPPVLSPKPIPPIPSSLEMASLRTRSSPALLSPDIARSPVPIMQDSPLSETARHSPNTVMYNPLTLPIARGLSGRQEQPQILPPLPRCDKMSHPVAAPIGASMVHGIPMATVVPSVVRNWGGYVQNGNGVSDGVPSNMFMRPSASDMMGLLASASVLTRRTPTLEQLLKTPSMVNKSQSAPVLSTAAAAQSATTASAVAATIHPMAAPVQSTAAVSSPPMTTSKHLADATLVRPVATSTHLAAHPITSAFKHAVQPLMSSSQSTGVLKLQSATMPSLPAAVGPLPLDKDSHEASALMKAYSTFEHTPAKTATQTFSCLQDAPARSLSQDRPSTVRTPKKEVQLEGAVSRNNDVKTSSSSSKILESSKLTVPVSSQHPVLAVPPMVVDSGSSPSERNIWSKLMPLGPPANSPRNLANSPRDAREQEVAEILSNMSTPLGSPAPPPMESPTPSPHPSRPCTPSREGRTLLGEGDSKHVGAFPCLESMLQKPPLSLSNNTVSTPSRTTSTMQQSTIKTRFSPPAKIKTSPESKTRTSIPATIRPGTDPKAQQPFSDKHSTETANRPNEPVCADKPSMPTIKTEVTETKAVKEQANVSPMRMSRDSESSAFSDTADTNMDGLHHRRYGRRSGTLSPRQQREFRRLKDSEGFVRDKKPPKTMNLYEDTSLLGREQRYLQRAMMRFQEMELADKGLPVEAVVRKTPSNKPVGVAGTRGRGGRYISSRHSCDTGQHHGPDRPHKAWHPRGRRRGMWQRGVERPRKIKRAVSRTSECSNNAEAASSSDLTKETGDTTAQQQKTSAHSSNSVSRNPGVKEESELFRPEMIYSRKNHLVVRKPGFQDFYPTILPTRTRGVAAANFSKYARKAGQNGSTTSMKMEAHRRARRHWARKAAAAESQQNDDDPEKSGFVDLNNLKVRINLKDLYRSNMAQQRKKLLKKCCSSTANPKVIPEQIEAQLSPKIKIQKCLVTEGPSSKGRYFARRTGGHPAFTYKVTSCNMSPSPVPECTADIPQEEAQEVRKRPGRKRGPPKALSEDVADLSTKPGGKRKYKSRHLEPEVEPVPIPARAPEEEIPAVDMELIHIKQEPLSDEDTVEYDQPEEEQEELEEEEGEVPHPDLPPMPPEMKKLLIQKSSGETVLHRASRLGYEEVVRYCLETRYVEVNSQDNAGYSPLHEASVRGHMAIVQDLILFGGDVNCSAQDGTRPIHDAVENDHVEIVRMLLSYGADPCLATYSGRTISSLCRSETMERFITDHFRDLAGREENDSNEGTWEFSGSCAIMEDRAEGNGMDVFADIPKEEESDLDDFEFEMSERPHLPSYNLLINLREGCRNYLLVDDVTNQLEISREQLMAKLANQTPVCVSKTSFLTQISESQVTEVPTGLVGCSGPEEPSRNSPPLSATDSTSPGAVQEKDQEVPGGTSFAKSFPFGERKVPDQVHTAENSCSSSQGDVKTTLENETTLGSYDYEVNLERGDERNLSDTLLAIGDLREDARHTDDDQTTDTYMKIGQELNSERQASGVLEHENVEQGYSGMESDVSIEVDKHEDQSSCVYENGSDQSLDQLSRKKEENTDEEENQPFSTKDSATVCKLQTTDGDANLGTTEILDRTETADGETYIRTESEQSAVADQSWAGAEEDQDRDMSSCSTTEGQSEYGEFEGRDPSVEEASHVGLTEEDDSMVERTEGQLYEENHETSSTSGSSDGVHIKETAVTEGHTLQNNNSPPTSDIAGSSHGDTETNSSPPTSDIVGSSHAHTQSPNLFGTENLNVWLDTNSSNQSNDELMGQSGHEPAGNQSEQSADVDSANLLVKLGANENAVRTESAVTRYSDGIVCSFETAARKTEEPVVELLELTSDLKELLEILTEKL